MCRHHNILFVPRFAVTCRQRLLKVPKETLTAASDIFWQFNFSYRFSHPLKNEPIIS